jgi:diguanylate cyclase
MGLQRELGQYVLNDALAEARRWTDTGIDLTVSINVTVDELHDPAFPERVAAALAGHGLRADTLMLEITESTLMTDAASARSALGRLSGAGVKIAIDDFGTGYSSLAYLRDLPVDVIKLDRSFVAQMLDGPGGAAIVQATIDLGRHLQREVVAEGIETADQHERLVELGCLYGQGFYFARPMSAGALRALLADEELPAAA